MRVICTACLHSLYVGTEKVPADSSRFPLVCPQCKTQLTVDPLQGKTFAEGAAAYADSRESSPQDSDLAELHETLDRMTVKVRAGMRRPLSGRDFGFTDVYDVEDND